MINDKELFFVVFFDSNTIRNFINQLVVAVYKFFAIDSTFRDSKIIDDTFFRIYLIHFFAMKAVENDKKMYKKTTNFVDANMINVNVILKMKFLIEINFLIN